MAELGTVSKAALRLQIDQTALSRQIIDLENELGLRHFNRVGRRLLSRKILELHTGGNDANQLYRMLANSLAVLEVFKVFRASLSGEL